jgi:hypothetical protein
MTPEPATVCLHDSSPRRVLTVRRLSILLLVVEILLGIAIRIHFFDPGIARSPDERTYTRQANIVLAQGTAGFHFLGQELAQNPPLVSRYPSPLRVGYITLLVAFMRITGDNSILAGAQLSIAFSIASLFLIALTGYRFLSPTVAVVATLFYAVFPFDLTIYRRTWQESLISLLTVSFLALATLIARTGSARRLAFLIAFALLGVLALTTKENSGIAFMLCAAGLTLYFLLQGNRRAAILTAASAAVAAAAYALILASLFGGAVNTFILLRESVHFSGINPYSVQFDSGPIWMFPAALLRTSPFLFLAALAGFAAVVYHAYRSRLLVHHGLSLGIALITASMIMIQLVTQRYSFRYTAPVFGPICLLAGMGVDSVLPTLQRLLAPLGRATAWAILGFAISVAAFRDFTVARDRFLLPELQDLALRPVLGVLRAPIPPGYPR